MELKKSAVISKKILIQDLHKSSVLFAIVHNGKYICLVGNITKSKGLGLYTFL